MGDEVMSRDSITTEPGNTPEVAADTNRALSPSSCILSQRGFTLLEMVMVMTIIVILATIGVTSYQQVQLKARETLLKEDLNTMRKLIDQYEADREHLPQSLDDLVSAGYMREIPIDPVTGEKDWTTETGEDIISHEGGQGIVNVHSNAQGQGSDGKAYSDY
jgi:general secretion pathway protein G